MPLPALLIAAALVAKPVPAADPRRWFTPADYPVDALIEQQQGVVGFELAVSPAGKPTGCRVYRSSGMKLLDEATCTLAMQRAVFKPPRKPKKRRKGRKAAAETAGPPQAAVYRHAVRWRLPNAAGTTDQTFVVHSAIAPNGSIETCTITGVGALSSGGSCGLFGNRAFLASMLGKDYARTATTDIRLDLTFASAPAAKQARTPNAYWLLAEAAVTFGASGRLEECVGLKALRTATRPVDLCRLIKAQPPRIAAGAPARKAVYSLDLSAYYR